MDYVDVVGKQILVTGGCGYLGSHLVKRFIELGASVHVVDIQIKNCFPGASYGKIDLNDINLLKEEIDKIRPNIVCHLAASLDRTRDFYKAKEILETNLFGTINLLNALETISYDNFIFVSTSEVYSGDTISTPFKEDASFVPASPYSLSKFCAEIATKTFSNINSKKFTILRVFNFFGENMPKSFFLSQLVNKLKLNQDFDMTFGEQKRDYLHVCDVVEAIIMASDQKAHNQTFNVCSGNGISIKDLAIQFKEHLKSNSNLNFGAIPYRKNEIWDMTGDNSKIKRVLGWEQRMSIFHDITKK